MPHPENEYGGCRMTKQFIVAQCKKNKLYVTPGLNDVLYLHFNGFTKIENLEEYHALKCLWLESNAISKIEGLNNQKHLKCLYLQNNLIKDIENLENCKELDTLNLCHNFIKEIQNCASDVLPVLSTLAISHNHLKSLDGLECLQNCEFLSVLDLSHNHIDDILVVKILGKMPILRVLTMTGNPVINSIPNYRKTFILECKELTFLDSRPVFPRDRACAEAWKIGGHAAERKEHERWNKEERRKIRRSVIATLKLRRGASEQNTHELLSSSEDDEEDSKVNKEKRSVAKDLGMSKDSSSDESGNEDCTMLECCEKLDKDESLEDLSCTDIGGGEPKMSNQSEDRDFCGLLETGEQQNKQLMHMLYMNDRTLLPECHISEAIKDPEPFNAFEDKEHKNLSNRKLIEVIGETCEGACEFSSLCDKTPEESLTFFQENYEPAKAQNFEEIVVEKDAPSTFMKNEENAPSSCLLENVLKPFSELTEHQSEAEDASLTLVNELKPFQIGASTEADDSSLMMLNDELIWMEEPSASADCSILPIEFFPEVKFEYEQPASLFETCPIESEGRFDQMLDLCLEQKKETMQLCFLSDNEKMLQMYDEAVEKHLIDEIDTVEIGVELDSILGEAENYVTGKTPDDEIKEVAKQFVLELIANIESSSRSFNPQDLEWRLKKLESEQAFE